MSVGCVATLVAAEGEMLSEALLQSIAAQLPSSHFEWLDEGKAADVFFDAEEPSRAEQSDAIPLPLLWEGLGEGQTSISRKTPSLDSSHKDGREALTASLHKVVQQGLSSQNIDIVIQPVAHRRKKLLLADMESTIIEQEMLDELAETIGLRDRVAAITARAMNGELDFAAALKERVGLLKGLPVAVLDQVAQRITMMPGAAELLATMKTNGASAWLVSGGFTYFARPVGERLGFDRVFANELVVCDGTITGEVVEPLIDKNAKRELLVKACQESGLSVAQTTTVGDGANDIPMLSACNESGGLGVAYHAKPNVRAVIPHQINTNNLRALLYAQGYRREDICLVEADLTD